MNTTAKLHSSLTATTNHDALANASQPNFPQPPNGNTPNGNTRGMPFDQGDYNDYPNTGMPGYYADPNLDELSLLEFRLQEMQLSYMKRKKYWEAKKEELLATYPIEDVVNTPVTHTIKDVLQRVYDELRALIAFPDSQLNYIYDRSRPQILKLEETLNEACDKLKKPVQNAGTPPSLEKAKVCLEICNASITLLSGLGSLVNDISREIKLCLKCQEIVEKTAVILMNFAITLITRFPMPPLDFNLGLKDLYRKSLFHSIQHEATGIGNFVTGAKGEVERANKAVNKFMPTANPQDKEQLAKSPQGNPFFNANRNNKPLAGRVQNDVNQPLPRRQAVF